MKRLEKKLYNQKLRSHRARAKLYGTAARPRLSVHISNHNVTAQIIDDEAQKTLVYVSTVGKQSSVGTMTERARQVGEEIAKKAKTAKISSVAFDRGARLYHGRIKALADAAREKGLEF